MQICPAYANAPGEARREGIEIGDVRVHQDGRVAAKLEEDALASRHRLEVPSDSGAPGKAQHREGIVSRQALRYRDRQMQDLEAAREGRPGKQLGQAERRERRLRRWLQHHRISRGDRRGDLVGDEIQGD